MRDAGSILERRDENSSESPIATGIAQHESWFFHRRNGGDGFSEVDIETVIQGEKSGRFLRRYLIHG